MHDDKLARELVAEVNKTGNEGPALRSAARRNDLAYPHEADPAIDDQLSLILYIVLRIRDGQRERDQRRTKSQVELPHLSTPHPMGMNIKDPEVHAMARQLAARRGTTVTDAVRQALSAELERSQATDAARQDDLQALLERFRRLHWPTGVNGKEAQDALYDEQGLPL